MKMIVIGMKVPEPNPAMNCAARNACRFGDQGARKLAAKKARMPASSTRRPPRIEAR